MQDEKKKHEDVNRFAFAFEPRVPPKPFSNEIKRSLSTHNTCFHSELTQEELRHRIEQREKQIRIGKNTVEYKLYLGNVPKTERNHQLRDSTHPITPKAWQDCSKRSFDGQIKKWKQLIHKHYC